MSNSIHHKEKRVDRAKQIQKENRMIRNGMSSGRTRKVISPIHQESNWFGKFVSLFGGKRERQVSKEDKKKVK